MRAIPVFDNPQRGCGVLVEMPNKTEGHVAPMVRKLVEKYPERVYEAATQDKLLSGIFETGSVIGYLTENRFTPIDEENDA